VLFVIVTSSLEEPAACIIMVVIEGNVAGAVGCLGQGRNRLGVVSQYDGRWLLEAHSYALLSMG